MDSKVIERQRRLFSIVDEFFQRATGDDVSTFAARGAFDEVVRERATFLGRRGSSAYTWFEQQLRSLYSETWRDVFRDARNTGGMKLVLGGSSRFSGSHFASVRKMLLYADSILIPDPLLPWLETERKEERFRHVNLLEQSFWLLHLKPLVDVDLPYPAVLVFPSWEKGLEERDAITQEGQFALTAAVVGHHLGYRFGHLDELKAFAIDHSSEFLEGVDKARLFLAPGADSPEPLEIGIRRYWDHVRTWRTEEHVASLKQFPESVLVLYAIMERLGPQYHLLENAEELAGQPMMCVEAHWYYHKLIAQTFEGQLVSQGSLSPNTIAVLRSLDRPAHEWLGNVPMSSLVDMRRNNENEQFRKRLAAHTADLHTAALDDLDRVAAEVGRGIAGLVADHKNEVRRIADTYGLKHVQTLAGGVVTAAALFAPALAPFVGGLHAPVAIAGRYAHTKMQERLEKGRAARSLTGVLALAYDQRN